MFRFGGSVPKVGEIYVGYIYKSSKVSGNMIRRVVSAFQFSFILALTKYLNCLSDKIISCISLNVQYVDSMSEQILLKHYEKSMAT